MATQPRKRRRYDYKRLCALKGLQRLQNLVPNVAADDEKKVIIETMFYVTQLEVKAEQLRRSVRRTKARPRFPAQEPTATATQGHEQQDFSLPDEADMIYNVSRQMATDTNASIALPEDLLDLDETELQKLHSLDSSKSMENLSSDSEGEDSCPQFQPIGSDTH